MTQIIKALNELASINTHWQNTNGIKKTLKLILGDFKKIADHASIQSLPPIIQTNLDGTTTKTPSWALIAQKRSTASFKILLSIHIDTVYPEKSPFQTCIKKGDLLHGPGVCDAKGGLIILMQGLKRFEKKHKKNIGWTVIINADEEIGSPKSSSLLIEHAKHHNIGLVFEPTLPNKKLVSQRKGSSNITLISHGIAAHAGRHFFKGSNAIIQLTELLREWNQDFSNNDNRIINIGQIQGGEATNQVPDLAIAKINIRTTTKKMMDKILQDIKTRIHSNPYIELEYNSYRPPKKLDPSTQQLLKTLKTLNPKLSWESSGGVCDGNTLSNAGLPTLDTMGPIGNHIHTHNEYVEISSIKEKTQLFYEFLNAAN